MDKIKEQSFNVFSNEGWETVKEKDGIWKRIRMIEDSDFDGMTIECCLLPAGFSRAAHRFDSGTGFYVIEGCITTEAGKFNKGTLVWHPSRHVYSCSTDSGCRLLFISSKAFIMEAVPEVPIVQETVPIISNVFDKEGWIKGEEPVGAFFDDKPVVTDPENGALVNFSHYPERFYKPYHRHTCSHGTYVIEGIEKTATGNYAAGSFLWHPAGIKAGHGPADGSDCLFLFIANRPFEIEFL